ncbi:DUF6090 family protein [Fulvivirga sedimenti]|uniref:Uncharacterized protein n=1 Tax=Fulvivirga sedimenti TaxID=2879465 RepID=A0A9X1HSN5_9BACT|nr:DUF6090 family protein [Fulvivirga sedimenti]MCA6074716.1 hypothetical protein [Fulvivirga sedimenti]MCA6075893.1 hypothetical protein [Fulvivirga sedimenti]MCA6077021.1 hypothetical protein [Fulvivirga sedimenti]
MIQFFRKIRQRLLSESRLGKPATPFGRYLVYAIGEVVLVVIGILIALSINNWNEGRKAQLMARDVYANLLTSLEQDSAEVENIIRIQTQSLEVHRKLILSGSNQLQINRDSLDLFVTHIASASLSFFPKTGVYDLIVSNDGIDLLKSARIKELLINLYDFQYKRYENVDAIIDHKYHYQLGPVLRQKIGFIGEYNPDFVILSHADPDLFREHYVELTNESKDIFGIFSTGRNYLVEISASINELLRLIRIELKK